MFIKLYEQTSSIAFAFFGLHVLLVGCLILRSTFLPRLVGALTVFGGVGWLTLSFTNLLSPPLARYLSRYIIVAGILGEASPTRQSLRAATSRPTCSPFRRMSMH